MIKYDQSMHFTLYNYMSESLRGEEEKEETRYDQRYSGYDTIHRNVLQLYQFCLYLP